MNIKETALVRKAVRGDKDAFTQLILLYEDTLYGTAMTILKNHNDAMDCVQDTVLIAYEKIATLREVKFFKTWLIRILINRCYNWLKDQNRQIATEFSEDMLGTQEDPTDTLMDVHQTLLSMKEKDRLVLTLYYLEDLSVKEIASLFSVSEGAVKLRLLRGRDHFKEIYNAKGVMAYEE